MNEAMQELQKINDAMASYAAKALDLLGIGSVLIPIEGTDQYVVAGTLPMIAKVLPADDTAHLASQSQATRAVPVPFRIGNEYQTQAGEWVRFVGIANEGTSYETMFDEKGHHRYTRRDFGRCTGTAHDYSDPGNTPPLYATPTAQEVTQQAAKAEPFPERDPSKPAAQQGLYRKFNVERTDGQSRPGNKHYGCRYYVLDLTHDQHAPAAMRAYAAACRSTHPQLAADIEAEFGAQAAPEEVRNQALEEVAKLIEQKVYAYTDECGIYDHTTGVTEYPGNGEEWVGEMGELVEEIRALKRTTSGKGEAA